MKRGRELSVKLSYTGCVVAPLWQDPVLARLEDVLQEANVLASTSTEVRIL